MKADSQREEEAEAVGGWGAGLVRDEVRAIERQLRGYAEQKTRHAAQQALHAKLLAEAEPLPPTAERQAAFETAHALKSAMDAYEHTAAARRAAVARLAGRIAEIQAANL